MAHERYPEIAARTLAGKHGEAADLAYAAYTENPTENVVLLASTYYSGWTATRRKKGYVDKDLWRNDLILLVPELIARASVLAQRGDADGLDVISTVLANLTFPPETKGQEVRCRLAALEVCELGLEACENAVPGGHTRALLLLTYAQLLLERNKGLDAYRQLQEACALAPHIKDANQKARVYRKLTYLYAKQLRVFRAMFYFMQLMRIRGIAPDVAQKNTL